jgi:hypothetical protein
MFALAGLGAYLGWVGLNVLCIWGAMAIGLPHDVSKESHGAAKQAVIQGAWCLLQLFIVLVMTTATGQTRLVR